VTEQITKNEAMNAPAEQYYRKPKQARGIVKFEMILDAANALIEVHQSPDISLYDVAKAAGVATGSVYHFFPTIESVFIALVQRYDQLFADLIRDIDPQEGDTGWQDLLVRHTERSCEFINSSPPALMLIIGPLRTWQSRLVDTAGDTRIAQAMIESYERHFVLPEHPQPEIILHHAIRILESLWELSYQQHGFVTEEMSRETNQAMIAYLGLYWPRFLGSCKIQNS
jgi:AcrR family transcriptional regulator